MGVSLFQALGQWERSKKRAGSSTEKKRGRLRVFW